MAYKDQLGDRTRLATVLLRSGTLQVLINVCHWWLLPEAMESLIHWAQAYTHCQTTLLSPSSLPSLSPENQSGCLRRFTYWTYVPGPRCEHEYMSPSI